MNKHKSVLYKEALEYLDIKAGKTYIDATINGGGHTRGILAAGGRVLGVDRDKEVIKRLARDFDLKVIDRDGCLKAKNKELRVVQGNFSQLRDIASKHGVWETPGILFDLGLSSLQLDDPKRGFAFKEDGPLDMRMDQNLTVTAADLVNGLNEGELYELFTNYGEEHFSRRVARVIVKARVEKKIKTTVQLAGIIERVVRRGKIHPATKTFQALRIAVNDELNNLKKGLGESVSLLSYEGRLVIISFHSLEDGIVKKFFKENKGLKIITKSPITVSPEEILENPRSRSAKIRVAERI